MENFLRARALLCAAVLVALPSACSSTGNTLAQELAWERWQKCNHFSGLYLNRIDSNGQILVKYGDGFADLAPWRACLQQAVNEQAQRPIASKQLGDTIAAASPSPESVPTWKPGDEWAYRWESPQGKGTFVWSVEREEMLDGIAVYVVKSGTRRELYYRKSDLAFYMEKLSGQIETKHTPPGPYIRWSPSSPKDTWSFQYLRERPLERQTEEKGIRCESGTIESITVPAGTFETVKITCRDTRTNAIALEVWPSLAVKHWVRERSYLAAGGVRERELIAVKLRP